MTLDRAVRRRIVTVAWVRLRDGWITPRHYHRIVDRANSATDPPYPTGSLALGPGGKMTGKDKVTP